MNLQELRKAKFKTIKAFTEAYGCSSSKVRWLLRGGYQMTLSKEEVQKIADILSVSFDECVEACDRSYAEFHHYSGDWETWKRRDGLEARWTWEDALRNRAKQTKETGNWETFRSATGSGWGNTADRTWTRAGGSATWTIAEHPAQASFTLFNLPLDATPAQVKTAFRDKVKSLADGKGGYCGDMDKLVQAKEAALRYAGGRAL